MHVQLHGYVHSVSCVHSCTQKNYLTFENFAKKLEKAMYTTGSCVHSLNAHVCAKTWLCTLTKTGGTPRVPLAM